MILYRKNAFFLNEIKKKHLKLIVNNYLFYAGGFNVCDLSRNLTFKFCLLQIFTLRSDFFKTQLFQKIYEFCFGLNF